MNQQIPEFGWWLKISTTQPMYIYYFGVFDSYYEAVRHKNGYIQDLSQEGSLIIDIQINRGSVTEAATRGKLNGIV